MLLRCLVISVILDFGSSQFTVSQSLQCWWCFYQWVVRIVTMFNRYLIYFRARQGYEMQDERRVVEH